MNNEMKKRDEPNYSQKVKTNPIFHNYRSIVKSSKVYLFC